MGDYKELICKLRMAEEYVKTEDGDYEIYLLTCGKCKEIADVIEQLVKERNTAVEDINSAVCDSCIKTGTPACRGADGIAISCNAYEWRGVRE